MQEITKMMSEMWKNMDGLKGLDFGKKIDFMKGFNTAKLGLQVLDFQKNAFEAIFNAMEQTQQQLEKLSEPFLKYIPDAPAEWKNILKKNQEDIKKAVDETFIKAESFFSPTSSPVKAAKPAKETTKEQTESKAK